MIFKYNLNKPPTAHFHSMAGSMQRYGQIMPILVVAATAPRHTLIDGYLRVAAARRLGHDTLLSYIWHGYEKHALCHILVKDDQRRWDIFEHAGQLLNRHQLSQRELSRLLSISSNTVRRVSNWKTGYMQQNCHCIEALPILVNRRMSSSMQ